VGKRHHYVPRFYLKAFASAPRQIHVFNLDRELAIENASLRDQCYARRMYGPDDEVESELARIENAASGVLGEIISSAAPPVADSINHQVLLSFLSLQLLRTLGARTQTERMSAALGQAVFEGPAPDDWTLTPDQALALAMSAAPGMGATLADLGMAVISVSDGDALVTSDNPVFRYNQYCEGIKHIGVTGTTLRGFQMYFPLSPRLLLLLFDTWVYKVGSRRGRGPVRATAADVARLNSVQFVAAATNIYFSEWGMARDLKSAFHSVRQIRRRNKPRINVAAEVGEDRSDLLHQFWPMPQLNLALSFLRVRKDARRIPLFHRIRMVRPPYARPPRPSDEPGQYRRFEVRRRI
jgi:hypothetical protein